MNALRGREMRNQPLPAPGGGAFSYARLQTARYRCESESSFEVKIPVYTNPADPIAETAVEALRPRDQSEERRHG